MKKYIFLSFLVLFMSNINAQVTNVNPDPNGEPWIIGGWKSPSKAQLMQIPKLQIDAKFKSKDLPASLDNSNLQYFRPIFDQTDGCCAQASGIAYNFTYEMNRARNTSASTTNNQFPTHYTYNFLNSGSGDNGSWYGDGWNIIKSNGCPTVADYGGIAQDATYWMSGFTDYETSMENKVVEIFNIDVSTEQGLEDLKYWMFNHADGSDDGGIVNFAAGISIDDYNLTYDNIVTKWGYSVNHAMTFVGWDDNIEYDFNNDGQITNNIDITGDGVVDMKDWERGAMIMVNSWGTYWGNSGKAYVMYRLLALPVSEGGIGASNMVSSILVRPEYTKQLTMRVTMDHSDRSMIKVVAGVSTNLSATEPDITISFPLFNYQGGSHQMRGTSSDPIEFSLDVTPLLSYINSGEEAKFFLQVYENDIYNTGNGSVNNFSIVNSDGTEFTSTQTNVLINNNDVTTLSVNGSAIFDAPEISTTNLPVANQNQSYTTQLNATGGAAPYKWGVLYDYSEQTISQTYPAISSNVISVDDNDDGYGVQQIDFQFPFGGQTYNQIYLRTDGSIAFEPGFTYLRSEDAIKNAKVISVFAADLMIYPENGDGIFYEGDENSATFRWKTSLYGQPDADIDVAITLYPDGTINFYYGNNITTGLSWASGVSAGDAMNFLITSLSGNYDPSNNMMQISGNDFPQGMAISKTGEFFGTPTEFGNWNIKFYVTDFDNITKNSVISFDVNQANNLSQVDNDFIMYPNPAKNYTFVDVDLLNSSDVTIKISDINGRILFSNTYNDNFVGSNKYQIDLTNFNSGVYFVLIEALDYTSTKKLIIK